MKAGSKIALALGAVAAFLFARKKGIAGIGATKEYTVIAKVVDVWWKNASMYGNPSYWVILETEDGDWMKCYTSPNASIGYEIKNGYLKDDWHVYTYTQGKNNAILHNVRKVK